VVAVAIEVVVVVRKRTPPPDVTVPATNIFFAYCCTGHTTSVTWVVDVNKNDN
jgi:hypothetical protein